MMMGMIIWMKKYLQKYLKKLNLGLKKINRKFKVTSLDGKTIDIELYSGHNRDSEIYQIYDLLKKLKLDKHKTSIFNDNVNYGDDEGPKMKGLHQMHKEEQHLQVDIKQK